jgi:adenylate cyclase
LRALLGDDPSVVELASRMDLRAGGNPFFLEEIVRAAAGAGRLEGERGAYRLALADAELEIPQTVQAVLAGRIDRLEPRDKQVLQTAAALGTRFDEALLERIGGLAGDQAAESLAALVELVPQAAAPGCAFRHPLTQEVAYGSQLESCQAAAPTPRARSRRSIANGSASRPH